MSLVTACYCYEQLHHSSGQRVPHSVQMNIEKQVTRSRGSLMQDHSVMKGGCEPLQHETAACAALCQSGAECAFLQPFTQVKTSTGAGVRVVASSCASVIMLPLYCVVLYCDQLSPLCRWMPLCMESALLSSAVDPAGLLLQMAQALLWTGRLLGCVSGRFLCHQSKLRIH